MTVRFVRSLCHMSVAKCIVWWRATVITLHFGQEKTRQQCAFFGEV